LITKFFALIYLWIEKYPNAIIYFFRVPENQTAIARAFQALVTIMKKYDADGSRRLSRSELDHMFSDLFPAYVQSGHYNQVVRELFSDQVFPPQPP
jgi:hypothetical protein